MQNIPYGRQNLNKSDINAVMEVLKSDYLTQGPVVPAFENAIATYCNVKHGVATNSATSSLHISCLALEVGKGDFVWTTPITFVASSNCALYCGAKIDFVDIDPYTYNMSVDRLAEKLAFAQKNNQLPKVVIPVHMCGQSCDMAAIYELSKKYGFKIIEDASHAIGSSYRDEPVGTCRYSDITIFSFHPVKIITTGEGGIALTNNSVLAKRMRLLRSHGISRNIEDMNVKPDGPWFYQQIDLGFNYRMTDIQGALGLSQLQRIETFICKRHSIAKRYNQLLSKLPLSIPFQREDTNSSYHLYIIRLKIGEINKSHLQIFEYMYDAGIRVNLHYIPVYLQPYYKNLGFSTGYCPEAEQYYNEAISLPIYPDLTLQQQDIIITNLSNALK